MRLLIGTLVAAAMLLAADTYEGRWSSENNGNGGEIRIAVKPEPNVVFTLGAQDVATTGVTAKSNGNDLEISYDFVLDGYKLRSTVKGTLRAGKFEGKYVTKSVEDGAGVDSGSVTASAR